MSPKIIEKLKHHATEAFMALTVMAVLVGCGVAIGYGIGMGLRLATKAWIL